MCVATWWLGWSRYRHGCKLANMIAHLSARLPINYNHRDAAIALLPSRSSHRASGGPRREMVAADLSPFASLAENKKVITRPSNAPMIG